MADQTGTFYAGVIGLPIRITPVDDSGAALIPDQLGTDEILSASLSIERPDESEFTRSLAMPGMLVGSAVQYVVQDGDLPVGGRYKYLLTLTLTNSRTLPVSGAFTIANVRPTA